MRLRKLAHHILLSIGILLGITVTGSTVNTKAAQTNHTDYNNSTTSQDAYNNGQRYQSSASLVNQSGYGYNNYQYDQGSQNRSNLNTQNVNDRSNSIYNHILKSSIYKYHHKTNELLGTKVPSF